MAVTSKRESEAPTPGQGMGIRRGSLRNALKGASAQPACLLAVPRQLPLFPASKPTAARTLQRSFSRLAARHVCGALMPDLTLIAIALRVARAAVICTA